jgi:hypothetical protein
MIDRERAVAAGLADPGQPSYETSYGRLAGSVDYCAIFSDLEPGCGLPLHRNGILYDTGLTNFFLRHFPFPSSDLRSRPPQYHGEKSNRNAAVGDFTWSKIEPRGTRRLFCFRPLTATNAAQTLAELGAYLQGLWVAAPANLRVLQRPLPIRTPLPDAPPVLASLPRNARRAPMIPSRDESRRGLPRPKRPKGRRDQMDVDSASSAERDDDQWDAAIDAPVVDPADADRRWLGSTNSAKGSVADALSFSSGLIRYNVNPLGMIRLLVLPDDAVHRLVACQA